MRDRDVDVHEASASLVFFASVNFVLSCVLGKCVPKVALKFGYPSQI